MIYRDKEDFLDEHDNLINIDNVAYLIQSFENTLHRLRELKRYYNNLNRSNVINHDVKINHAKEITDLATSYTYGMPIVYIGLEDYLSDYFTSIDEDSHNFELGKDQSIYGKAYELISIDDDNDYETNMPCLTELDVFNTFIVQDNTNKHKTFLGVYYTTDVDKSGNIVKYIVTIYTRTKIYTCIGSSLERLNIQSEEDHYFGEVPILQLNNNKEEKGDFEDVIGLIDAYNMLQNNRCIDKQQFVDKLLVIVNSSLGDTDSEVKKSLKHLKEDNLLQLESDEDGNSKADAKYINVALDEASVEILRNAIINDIHKIAKVPDLTGMNISANTSGVAMAYTLFSTEQLAGMKERAFKKLLRQRFKLINNVMSLTNHSLDLVNIGIKFKRNVPDNMDEKLKELQGTANILSLRTRLQRYDSELDIDEEIKQLQEEKKAEAQMMAQQYSFGQADFRQTTDKNIDNTELVK